MRQIIIIIIKEDLTNLIFSGQLCFEPNWAKKLSFDLYKLYN